MNPMLSPSPNQSESLPSYLSKPKQQRTVLGWWYRVSSPVEPKNEASFQEMEAFRRGRTGSQIILALYILLIVSLFAQFIGTNQYLDYIVGGSVLLLTIACILNRFSKINLAGIIIVITFLAFPILNIVTTPGGITMMALPLFGLLILPVVCAVSFLPPWWVFIVAFTNIAFTWCALNYLPRTVEVDAILAIDFIGVILPIVLTQVIIAIMAFVWVQATTHAHERADRYEQIANLEHDLAKQAEESAIQKELLAASIQQIQETHMRVANGDFSARVPLTTDNVLWQISGALNNLLSRMQRSIQEASSVPRLTAELQETRQEVFRLKQQRRLLQ